MEFKYQLKFNLNGPPEEGHVHELKIPNRTRIWEHDGIEHEPDERRAEAILKSTGVDVAKPISTPGSNCVKIDEDGEYVELIGADLLLVRSAYALKPLGSI